MQDENRKSTSGGSNGIGSTLVKEVGKSVVGSALAGLLVAVITRGAVWAFPKLKV